MKLYIAIQFAAIWSEAYWLMAHGLRRGLLLLVLGLCGLGMAWAIREARRLSHE